MSNVATFALMIEHRNYVNELTVHTNNDIVRITKVKSLSPIAKELVINLIKKYFYQILASLEEKLIKDIADLKKLQDNDSGLGSIGYV